MTDLAEEIKAVIETCVRNGNCPITLGEAVQWGDSVHALQKAIVQGVLIQAELESALANAIDSMNRARRHLSPGMRAGTAEAIAILNVGAMRANEKLAQKINE